MQTYLKTINETLTKQTKIPSDVITKIIIPYCEPTKDEILCDKCCALMNISAFTFKIDCIDKSSRCHEKRICNKCITYTNIKGINNKNIYLHYIQKAIHDNAYDLYYICYDYRADKMKKTWNFPRINCLQSLLHIVYRMEHTDELKYFDVASLNDQQLYNFLHSLSYTYSLDHIVRDCRIKHTALPKLLTEKDIYVCSLCLSAI